MKMFNHVQIKVKDLKISRKFYDAVMAVLGYKVVLEIEGVVGYGLNVHDMFEIRQYDEKHPLSQHVHVAFNAKSRESVDLFYHAALSRGGMCNGEPGFRAQYGEGYYAAFVIDPNGHNIEAVYVEQ